MSALDCIFLCCIFRAGINTRRGLALNLCLRSFFAAYFRNISRAITLAMIPDDSQDCSGLEAVTNQHYSHDTPSFEGMQVVPDSGIQVNFQKTGLEVVQNDHNPELCSDTAPGAQHLQSPRSRRLPRKWLCSGGFAIFLIVAAAVLGGVLGTRANSKLPSASSSTTPSSSSDHSTTVNADNPVQSRHNLAALSFALDSVDTTRVYYQDNAGEIVEAATSTEHSEWIHNNLGFFAKNGSAIGAAVSRPGFIPVTFDSFSGQVEFSLIWCRKSLSYILIPKICFTISFGTLRLTAGLKEIWQTRSSYPHLMPVCRSCIISA